jgi:GT2 family glycosyltransferase/tetratricopeptide (TPR) repeat protein
VAHLVSFAENIRLADHEADTKNWPSAAEHYAKALLIDVSNPLLVQYGHMLKEAGFLENAAKAYRAATVRDGTDADAYLHLGHLLKRLGLAGEALSVFQALEKIPHAPYVRPEIEGLGVARINAAHFRTMPTVASDPLPRMSDGLQLADLHLQETLKQQAQFREDEDAKLAPRRDRRRPAWAKSVQIPVTMEPVAHLVVENGAYRATTANPRMRVEIINPFEFSDVEESWIELTLRIDAREIIVDPVLLIEHKAGWADFTAVPLVRRSSHVFGALVRIRGPVLDLRLDPIHSSGTFTISQPRLKRLSAMSVLLRALTDNRTGRASKFLRAWISKPQAWDTLLEEHFRQPIKDPYERWIERFDKPQKLQSAPRSEVRSKIRIGLLLPVAERELEAFRLTLESLKAQTRTNWELLVLVDDSGSGKLGASISAEVEKDARVGMFRVAAEAGLGAWLEIGRTKLQAEFVGHIQAGDRLSSGAVEALAGYLAEHDGLRALYCDDDLFGEDGKRHSPRFKPDWNADYCHCYDYVGRSVVYSAAAVRDAGGYRSRFLGNEDFDLLLRVASTSDEGEIGHLARPLWHYANAIPEKDIKAPVEDVLAAGDPAISVEYGEVSGTLKLVWPTPSPPPHVTIIIPTRDRVDLLKRAVDTILTLTDYPAFDIIVVDNGSVEAESLEYFAEVAKPDKVSILRDDGAFNFSRLNNRAADVAVGSVLALVNNDVEVVDGRWLSEMVPMAVDRAVGAVGAKLLYASGHVQHAGIVGGVGYVAAHGHKYFRGDDRGYMNRLVVQQETIAVTAACLVVEAAKYQAVGGLDEENLTVAFNDVDLCLKLAQRGWRTMFTPCAILHHHESLSRGLDIGGLRAARFKKEADHMIAKWGETLLEDRFYSPSLTRNHEDFSLSIVDIGG